VLVGMVVLSGAIAVVPGSTRLRGGLKRRVRCWDAAGLIATDLIDGWLGGDEVRVINSGHAVKVVNRHKIRLFVHQHSASDSTPRSISSLSSCQRDRQLTYLIAGCCSEGGMLPLPPLARDGEEECSSS